MTVYGGPRPSLPGPKHDKVLLGAAAVAVLAVVVGIVLGARAFMSDDPQATGATQTPLSAGEDSSAPAPPPSAAPPPSPAASPTPSPTPPKAALLAAKPSLIRPDHSQLCLQANGGNGGNTTQQGCDGNNPTEMWVPQAIGGSQDTFQFVNAADNRCLSVSNNSKDNFAQVWLWDCHADIGQLWKLVPDNGGYRLLNPNSNRCLTIEGGNPQPGAVARIFDCNGQADERYKFQPLG
ncbi:RICIN domain-containing protein [Dactylosporangium sp. CA-052675]|uniref:RICIN domain-containing protein n=1 Tax=Dactylosporangium sp. CA-052675 TaxID=3239927 RepID=UPI003D8A6755